MPGNVWNRKQSTHANPFTTHIMPNFQRLLYVYTLKKIVMIKKLSNNLIVTCQERQFLAFHRFPLVLFRSREAEKRYMGIVHTMPPPDYSSSAMRDRRMWPCQWGKIYESNPVSLFLTADRRGSRSDVFLLCPPALGYEREIKLSDR